MKKLLIISFVLVCFLESFQAQELEQVGYPKE